MWRGRFQELKQTFHQFFEDHCVPNEATYAAEVEAHRRAGNPWVVCPIVETLKEKARALGLWNLFLPHASGLTQREYAEVAETMGRVPCFIEVFNCDAPDSGNMEVLHTYGTPDQKAQWLAPLMDGTIRSAFCMTEPDVASSDAFNIACAATIVPGGDGGREAAMWCINGRKWWSTGAGHPRTEILIVMVRTDDGAAQQQGSAGGSSSGTKVATRRHQSHTMLLVPRHTPGVTLGRALHVFGDDDAPKGHFEVSFNNVLVPVASSTILGIGKGFEIAQGRLGPGRVHHCMRSIGMAERALELMVQRSMQRKTFGKRLAQHGMVQHVIARSRLDIDQARLLVLHCAALLDEEGCAMDVTKPKSLRLLQLIALIKVAAPQAACAVIDRAIQIHGGHGLSQDSILWKLYAGQRSLRIADGPDEVHEMTVARCELKGALMRGAAKL